MGKSTKNPKNYGGLNATTHEWMKEWSDNNNTANNLRQEEQEK